MKRILIFSLMMIIGSSLFAIDFQIGPVIMYSESMNNGLDFDDVGIEDFQFGADARLNLGHLQIAAMGLYEAEGDSSEPAQILLVPTIGVNFSILMIDLGIGAGPGITINFGDGVDSSADMTLHVKGTADINLGKFSTGIIVGSSFNFSDIDYTSPKDNVELYGGIAFLFNL